MDEGAGWRATELRSITARLQRLRNRLAALAEALRLVETNAAEGAPASEAVSDVQRRAWIVATDLVGVVGRLELLARDLRRSATQNGSAGPSAEVAEILRSTIECVIADRLDPERAWQSSPWGSSTKSTPPGAISPMGREREPGERSAIVVA